MSTASQSSTGNTVAPAVETAPWPGGVRSTLQSGENRVYFATSTGWSEAFIPQDDATTSSSGQTVGPAGTSATEGTGGSGGGKI